MSKRKAKSAAPSGPTAAQEALLRALDGVRYLRVEKGGEHSPEDAEALERLKLVELDYKTITGREMVACVVKPLRRPSRGPAPRAVAVYAPNTRVNVDRHRHGWEPGGRAAVIKSTYGRGYIAVCEETGAELEIMRHRDVTPL